MWEGVLKALAVVFLTWMGFSMLKADDWLVFCAGGIGLESLDVLI